MPVPSSPGATARALIAAGVDLDQELPDSALDSGYTIPPTLPVNPLSQLMTTGALLGNALPGLKEDFSEGLNEIKDWMPERIEFQDFLPDIYRKGIPRAIDKVKDLFSDVDRQDEISRLKQYAGGMKGYGDFNISDEVQSQSALTLIDNMVTSSEDAKLIAGSDTKKAVESAVEKWLLPALGIGDVKADIFKSPRIEVDQTEIQEKRDAELRTLLDKAKSEVLKGVDFEAPRSRPRYRGMKPVNKESALNRLSDLPSPMDWALGFGSSSAADIHKARSDKISRLVLSDTLDTPEGMYPEVYGSALKARDYINMADRPRMMGEPPLAPIAAIGAPLYQGLQEGVLRGNIPGSGSPVLQTLGNWIGLSSQDPAITDPSRVIDENIMRNVLLTEEQLRPGVGTESGVGTDIVPVRGPTSQVDTFADMPTAVQKAIIPQVETFEPTTFMGDRDWKPSLDARTLGGPVRGPTAEAAERVQQAAIQRKENDARARAKEVAAAERQREQQREGARRRAEEQAQARQREQQREGARRRAEEQREQAARARESARREQQRERKQAAAERAARNKEAQQRQRQQERAQAASRRAASRAAAARAAASRARPTPVRRRTGGRPSRTWRQPSRGRGR